MRMLFGRDEQVARFVADMIPGCEAGFGNCKAIGVVDDETGELVAGMVFHDWQPGPGLIQISSASLTPRWLTAEVRHKMFSYPFDEVGCQMVVLQVSAANERMVRIAKAFGFTPHFIARMRGRNEDGYVFTLTDDAWRNSKFTRKHHGQA
jgi:RimJ/RimL family protein N-acetyltransferase